MSARATARPMPLPAPVTRAILSTIASDLLRLRARPSNRRRRGSRQRLIATLALDLAAAGRQSRRRMSRSPPQASSPPGPSPLAYVARPQGKAGGKVLVLHAWWGLNDFIRGLCDRF